MEERKTNEELLAEANKQIEELRNQYAQVATEIENLMKQNNQAPVQDYQQRLNTLLQKRDLINEKVSPILESQRVYQSIIDNKKKEEHKAVLSQVERILNYRITDTAGYEYNSELKAPQVLAKDKSTLREEQGRITIQLDNMYYDGQLDMKTWQTMKSHIRTEFDEMIKNAPAPVQTQNNNSQQNQQSQNSNSQHGTYSEQAEHMNGYSGSFNRKFKSVDETTNDILHSRSEEEIEQMRIQLEREQLKEKYGLSDDMLDEIIRQQQMLEFQNNQADNIEQTEQIEHTGHRMR